MSSNTVSLMLMRIPSELLENSIPRKKVTKFLDLKISIRRHLCLSNYLDIISSDPLVIYTNKDNNNLSCCLLSEEEIIMMALGET